jgi:RHS repeat-associated protein
VEKGTNAYYYHADGLGSITALSDSNGSIVQTYSYDSFGNMTATGNIRQPFTYTAREYDYATGMYFYRARYYDPKVGRFVTKDPIGFAGGDFNLYNYVGGNPVNWADPLGLDRYNLCAGCSGISCWICRKYVDWGCSGQKNIACCEAEQKECIAKIDQCSPNADNEMKKCYADYAKCMSKTKK